jgi:hypothetical protein
MDSNQPPQRSRNEQLASNDPPSRIERYLEKHGDRLTFISAVLGLGLLSCLSVSQAVAATIAAQQTLQSIRAVVASAQTAADRELFPAEWNRAKVVPATLRSTLPEWPVAEISKAQLCQYTGGADKFLLEEYRLCIGSNPRYSGKDFQAGDPLTPAVIGDAATLPPSPR